ncbi:MAG: AsnC family transcriptional regulator [Alphaproteobacteria bacterium]|nr:AsnC family transcriptional regulator [Alphaproteobacteria bacterium]
MDAADRRIINALQGGFPVSERPFRDAAVELGLDEGDLIRRIERLQADGYLSRFGPLYDAENMGGAKTLAALSAPEAEFERVTEQVNAFDAVAHNYQRAHDLNMWFVVCSDTPGGVKETLDAIEAETGLKVYDMPKLEEFFIGLKFELDEKDAEDAA